jgi:uncharacterized membrane protein
LFWWIGVIQNLLLLAERLVGIGVKVDGEVKNSWWGWN